MSYDEDDDVEAWYVWVTGKAPEFFHGSEGSAIDRYTEKHGDNIKLNQTIHVVASDQVATYNVGVAV